MSRRSPGWRSVPRPLDRLVGRAPPVGWKIAFTGTCDAPTGSAIIATWYSVSYVGLARHVDEGTVIGDQQEDEPVRRGKAARRS